MEGRELLPPCSLCTGVTTCCTPSLCCPWVLDSPHARIFLPQRPRCDPATTHESIHVPGRLQRRNVYYHEDIESL